MTELDADIQARCQGVIDHYEARLREVKAERDKLQRACDLLAPASEDMARHTRALEARLREVEAASALCAICTPERDHNGDLCRRHANERAFGLKIRLREVEAERDHEAQQKRNLFIEREDLWARVAELKEALRDIGRTFGDCPANSDGVFNAVKAALGTERL